MGKWVHRLSNKDTSKKIGNCAKCGKIGIRWHVSKWRCWNAFREQRIAGDKYYRRYIKYLTKLHCEHCGFIDNDRRMFDIDHKDGNRKNNKMENLQLLCPICHRRKTIKTEPNWFTARERENVVFVN